MKFTKLYGTGIWLAAVVASLILASCGDDTSEPVLDLKPNPVVDPVVDPDPDPDPELDPEPILTAETAVLVYMVADNSLGTGGYDVDDMEEMQQAVDAGVLGLDNRLLIYRNRRGTDTGNVPVIIEMKKDALPDTLMVYPDNPSIYSTDSERMREVLGWFNNEVAAKHRGLVLWSHATGWVQDGGARSPARSWGNDRGIKMTMASLSQGLEGSHFDFIYFDCCHMMTVESLYEIRDKANVFAGSVTELPAPGMPYDLTLPHFFNPGGPDVIGAAKETFANYDALSGMDRTCTISVVKSSALAELALMTARMLASGAVEGMDISRYQQYSRSYAYKLYDLGQWGMSLTPVDATTQQLWSQALDDAVIYAAATPTVFEQIQLTYHSGLACGIPKDHAEAEQKGYTALKWWVDVASHNNRLN